MKQKRSKFILVILCSCILLCCFASNIFSAVKNRVSSLEGPSLSISDVAISLTSKGYPQIEWTKVEDAVTYQVHRKTGSQGTYSVIATTSSTNFIDETVDEGTEYIYRVSALSESSSASSSSNEVTIITEENIGYVKRQVWTIAHRGSHATEVQNSIQAMIAAFNDGFDLIEVDIRKCKDGTYVLSHDDKVKMYYNGNKETLYISESNYEDIRDYTWDKEGDYLLEPLPSFFNTMRDYDINIICDLKDGRNDEIVQIALESGMLDRIMLSYSSPQAALDDIELLQNYHNVPVRVIPLSYSQTIELKNSISNELYADVNASVEYYREYCLNIGLSCDLPLIFAGCTMDNTAVWAGVADGCMANKDLNITVDQFNSAVMYNDQYPCSIVCVDQLSLSVNETVDFVASTDTAGTAGYVYAYSLDPNVLSLRQIEFGQNCQIQVTGITEGTTAIRLFTVSGSAKDITITVSATETP